MRIMGAARLLSSSVALLLALQVGCSGQKNRTELSDEDMMARDVQAASTFVDGLEYCSQEELDAAEPIHTVEPAAGEEGTFSGELRLGRVICTLMLCPDRACCNGCGADLLLQGDEADRGPFLRFEGQPLGSALGFADCSTGAVEEVLGQTRVVVKGRFAESADSLELVVERLCRVNPGD